MLKIKNQFYLFGKIKGGIMEDKELMSIVKDYYDFIIKYEKHISKTQISKPQISKIQKNPELDKIFETIFKCFEEENNKYYRPWLTLTKGKEIEELYEIFSTFNEKSMIYSDVASIMADNLEDMGEMDLENYLRIENSKIVCENLFGEEVENDEKLEFSEQTLTLLKYYKMLNPICERLHSYISKAREKQEKGDLCL